MATFQMVFTSNCTGTAHSTVCTVHCEMDIVHCTLCTVHCTQCTVQCTLCSTHCALCSTHCALCNVHCTQYAVQYKLCTETRLPKCLYLSRNRRLVFRVCLCYQQVLGYKFSPLTQPPSFRYRGLPQLLSTVTITSQATAFSSLSTFKLISLVNLCQCVTEHLLLQTINKS